MRHDEIDRILSEEEDIIPSSDFVPVVMDAVLREATTPPPIPFPWKRGLAGLAASILVLVLFLVVAPPVPAADFSALVTILEAATAIEASWIVLALLLSFASVTLSMRLAGGRA